MKALAKVANAPVYRDMSSPRRGDTRLGERSARKRDYRERTYPVIGGVVGGLAGIGANEVAGRVGKKFVSGQAIPAAVGGVTGYQAGRLAAKR